MHAGAQVPRLPGTALLSCAYATWPRIKNTNLKRIQANEKPIAEKQARNAWLREHLYSAAPFQRVTRCDLIVRGGKGRCCGSGNCGYALWFSLGQAPLVQA